jgi:hypothetical protein
MQPGVMKAQKREILIIHVKKILYLVLIKFTFSMELEVFFTIIQQTYSRLVIRFMNRKSSCGYATHFFYIKTEYPNHESFFEKLCAKTFVWFPG